MTGWRKRQIGEHITKDEVLKLALEFFETMQRYKGVRSNIFIKFEPTATGDYVDLREFDEKAKPLVTAIKEALAQPAPVQEPVAWMDVDEKGAMSGLRYWSEPDNRHEVALYTTPPQRIWVGLTDEELEQLSNKWRIIYGGHVGDFAHEIEAKLKEKNFD